MYDFEEEKYYLKRTRTYLRVSTEEQARSGYSIDAQREELAKFMEKHHMIHLGEYCDDGVSARKEIRKRKQLMRLLKDIEAGDTDYILFIRLDRWFRSVAEYYKVQEILDTYNVGWKAICENYDTTTTNGRLNLNIRLSVAQDESDRTGDRIRFVNESRIRNGFVITGNFPLGLKAENGKVVHDEKGQEVVQALFDCYEACQSKRQCITDVKNLTGVSLVYNTVTRMLTNTIYKGEYKGNKTYCDPSIDPARFDRIQDMLERNHTHRTGKNFYIFSRMVFCATCGHTMIGGPFRDVKMQKSYLRYRCTNCWTEKRCTNKTCIWEGRIEKYLIANVRHQLTAYITTYEVNQAKAEKRSPATDIAKVKTKMLRLKDLYVNELIDMEAYRQDYEDLKKQLAVLEKKESQTQPRDLGPLKAFLEMKFEDIYDSLTPQEKRALWTSIIKRIDVEDTYHIKVTFL